MKVLCLLGSPRPDGNSTAVARHLCDRLAEQGAQVSLRRLYDLSFSGCRNRFHCKTGGIRCGLEDDLTPILAEVEGADVLVLASPIYFTDVSSGLKAVIERFFSFFVPDYATAAVKSRLGPGKRLVLVQTQGEDRSAYGDLLDRYAKSFRMLGFEGFHLIRACGVREPGAVHDLAELWTKVDQVAAELKGEAGSAGAPSDRS